MTSSLCPKKSTIPGSPDRFLADFNAETHSRLCFEWNFRKIHIGELFSTNLHISRTVRVDSTPIKLGGTPGKCTICNNVIFMGNRDFIPLGVGFLSFSAPFREQSTVSGDFEQLAHQWHVAGLFQLYKAC